MSGAHARAVESSLPSLARVVLHKLSVVVPLYNESAHVDALCARLHAALGQLGMDYEIVMVDDGSHDSTPAKLAELHRQDGRVKVICLRRNFGQHAAIFAGFDHASGDVIVTIDADLQYDPNDIGRLVEGIGEGYDVVNGWRVQRQDGALRRKLPSRFINWYIAQQTGLQIRDYGSGLKAFTPQAAREIAQYGRTDGWYPMLFGWLGFKVAEVQISHEPRAGGTKSRYNVFTQFDQFMSLFTGLAVRPFQVVELFGAGIVLVGGVLVIGACLALLHRDPNVALSWLAALGTIVSGIIIGLLGLLGEYVVRIHYEIRDNPKYLIRSITD